jgi:hypothetical protein
VAGIQDALDRLAGGVALSGAKPGTVAGHAAYTVRLAPRHDGGLLGAAELAWDAQHGVPLRAAVYAQGERQPVLELQATEVRFGPVSDGDVTVSQPAGARVVQIDAAASQPHGTPGGAVGENAALGTVQARLPFKLSAPSKLAGLPRRSVRTVRVGGATGAMVTYGKGLGALVVLQTPAGSRGAVASIPGAQELALGGATGHELATALGTVVMFQRAGVAYTVLGSVPPAAAEAAARTL